ncbi:MAG TPA: hypothetical protein VIS73_12720 [Rhodocyclaceae bacterium]
MNTSVFQKLPLAVALAAMPLATHASPAGTLLFAKGGTQIVDPSGVSRIGKAGDLLQPGERVVTPDGAVCQIKLWDGTLVGVRPDTELKVELPEQASARAKSVIQVLKGGLRVINLDLRDGRTRLPVTLQSPTGVVDLTNADAESRVVSPETLKKSGVKDPGLYTRVQIGKGTIRTGTGEVPIAIRTVAFTPMIDVAPTLVTASGSLFTSTQLSSTTLSTTTLTTATVDPKLTTSLSTTTLDPKLTTSLSTTTLDPKLTTSLSTTTLEPILSTSTLSTTFTSPTLATSTYTAPTTTTTLSSPTLSTTYIAPTTYTAPTTTTTMVSSTTLSSPTLTTTTTTSGTTTTFTSKTGSTLTLR